MVSYLIQYDRWHCLVGIPTLLLVSWYFSGARAHIRYRTVAAGLLLQVVLGFFMLRTHWGLYCMGGLSDGIMRLYQAASAGIMFVFGDLARSGGASGFVFAIQVLPMIIFFGAFMNMLFYWGVISTVVRVINTIIRPFLGTTGCETACAIGNTVLGQTEAPLLIRHYLASMTESEIFLVMVSGMGTLSAAIIAVYAAMGIPVLHLLTSCIMAIPSAIVIAKLLQPEEDRPHEHGDVAIDTALVRQQSLLETIGQGTLDGLQLAVVVGAILISYIGIITLIDMVLYDIGIYTQLVVNWLRIPFTVPHLSLSWFLSFFGRPVMWLLGLSGTDAQIGASVWGMRIAANEMVAYTQLLKSSISPRAVVLLTYALCGFANISSIGIQINSIGLLAPSKKSVLMKLGGRAMGAAVVSNLLTACIIGIVLP